MLVSVSGARRLQSSLGPSMAEKDRWMKVGEDGCQDKRSLEPLQFPAPLVQDKQIQKQLKGESCHCDQHRGDTLCGLPERSSIPQTVPIAFEEHDSLSPTNS